MRYLITGGAGFIGSHLAETLLTRGDDIVLLDDFSTGRPENVAHLLDDAVGRVELLSGSVLDADLVADAIGRVDVVAHLAASVGVQLIVARPLETLLNNVRGTAIRDGVTRHVTVGDVVVIPGYVPHWWSRTDSDLTYLVIRPDPDKVLPIQ